MPAKWAKLRAASLVAAPSSPEKKKQRSLTSTAVALHKQVLAKRAEHRELLRTDPATRTAAESALLRQWCASTLNPRVQDQLSLDVVSRVMRYRALAATEVLYAECDPSDALYIVLSGTVSEYLHVAVGEHVSDESSAANDALHVRPSGRASTRLTQCKHSPHHPCPLLTAPPRPCPLFSLLHRARALSSHDSTAPVPSSHCSTASVPSSHCSTAPVPSCHCSTAPAPSSHRGLCTVWDVGAQARLQRACDSTAAAASMTRTAQRCSPSW
jgi:hypothetical protein